MAQFACVLFQVGPSNSDGSGARFGFNFNGAADAKGQVVLADLVSLGEIGIEVVLSVPFAEVWNIRSQSNADHHGKLNCFSVEHRKGPGQGHGDRIHQCVRRGIPPVGMGQTWGRGEVFALGGQFKVNFHTHHGSGRDDLHGRCMLSGRVGCEYGFLALCRTDVDD